MQKYYRYIRIFAAVIITVLCILPFVNDFYSLKIFDIQFVALLQNVLTVGAVYSVLLFLLLFISFLFGRLYCSTVCPLGLLQEFFMLICRRKIKFQKNYIFKYFIAAVVFGTLISGTTFIVRLIDPYSIFGNTLSGAIYGIIFTMLLFILVFFKGRFFCSNICPVGTILGVIAKKSLLKINIDNKSCVSCGTCAKDCPVGCIDFKNKEIDNETCIKCFKCLKKCPKNAIFYGKDHKKEIPFSLKRRQLLIGSAVLLTFAGAYKSGVELSKEVAKKVKNIILPAGAKSKEQFINKCLNCNLCVAMCPMKIIKKKDEHFNTVHIDYDNSFCDFECNKCSQVCPSGAIEHISLKEKQKTQIALAKIDEEKCVKCGLCIMKCPRKIIKKDGMVVPTISSDECIGCGMCRSACPVKAIEIVSIDKQKVVK